MTRFFSKNFLRLLTYGLPISLLILFVPSGDRRSWFDEGYGWPLFYGWRATDVRPRPLPSIEDSSALVTDWLVGVALFIGLACVGRYMFLRRQSQPGAAPNGGPATSPRDSGVMEGPPSVS